MTTNKNDSKKKVAIYCRVSTHDQSCERQQRDLVAFAERAEFEVVGIFKETASGAKDSRVIRKEVIELARQRYISSILVTELSRWGRSTPDLVSTLNDLQSWGVNIISLNGVQFDVSTAQGKMFAQVLAAFAEFERDLIKERVKSGLASRKARGQRVGRAKGDYYKSDKMVPKVFQLLTEKVSQRDIAKHLNIGFSTVKRIVVRIKSGTCDHLLPVEWKRQAQ